MISKIINKIQNGVLTSKVIRDRNNYLMAAKFKDLGEGQDAF